MALNVYEYNQHFVAMMNVINAARLNPPKSGHKHHIIPRCWFKMNNLPIDNSADNLVLLSYEDHVKVHKLMYLCAISGKFKSKMACAYHKLTQGDIVANGCFKGELHPMYGRHHSKKSREKMSQSHIGHSVSIETRRKLSASHKGVQHPLYGKHHSNESKNKMAEAFKGKTWKLINGKRVWLPKEIV